MSRLLASIAIIGLLLAPIARPAIAMTATDMMGMSAMAGMDVPMPDDMPCCQDDVPLAPSKDCKQDCPFIALCMTASTLSLPAGSGLALPFELKGSLIPKYHLHFTSLSYAPPLRPPTA